MLFREDEAGPIAISQPAHAWISGQMARAWGSEAFGRFEPHPEVCLGAEVHDLGWLDWERAPRLDLKTGRPFTFLDLPLDDHLRIWSEAPRTALALGRYPALLVSLHGTGLYERHGLTAQRPPEELRAIRDYITSEQAWQETILASLRADPRYAPVASPEVVERNRRLVAAWDWMSLAVCLGVREPRTIEGVPAASGPLNLRLSPIDGDPDRLTVEPWPFREPEVTLVGDGRRLVRPFESEQAMRIELARAPWVALTITLRPAIINEC